MQMQRESAVSSLGPTVRAVSAARPIHVQSQIRLKLYVPPQELLTECRESDEAGEAVISRRDAATRGIAAALQVGVETHASFACTTYSSYVQLLQP